MRLSSLVATMIVVSGLMLAPGFDIASAQGRRDRVVSLLGEELPPSPLPSEIQAAMEAKLAAAQEDYLADPQSAEATIWMGRRLAYLGRYGEAIEIYTRGIENHPEDARMYRHRGHRFITTRQLDRAIVDLAHAADLIAGTEDQVEPDGLPNVLGIPTSTLQSNIWYHLGLAHYLKTDFQSALDAYHECLEVSKNPDMLVATSHWLYMTLRRLGRDEDADEVLSPISPEMEVIENDDYLRLLLLYRGDLPLAALQSDSGDDLSSSTVGYGIGNWHLYNGREAEASAVFRHILEGREWAAFGFIAAEAEMARHSPSASPGQPSKSPPT